MPLAVLDVVTWAAPGIDGLRRLLGDAPDLVPLEELVRVVDVVLPVHVRLHPEQVLGVAEVSSDLGGDLLTRR